VAEERLNAWKILFRRALAIINAIGPILRKRRSTTPRLEARSPPHGEIGL
jgi:hypothetical protein